MALVSEENSKSQSSLGSFKTLGLDRRILKSLRKLKWESPTAIQASALPLALSGKDLLIQATTGSGKTAIFVLPMVQKILQIKESKTKETKSNSVLALVLCPSKELCIQTEECFVQATKTFPGIIVFRSLDPTEAKSGVFSSLEVQFPDVLIGTPRQVSRCLSSFSGKIIRKVKLVAIDEADAMFSCGFEKDLRETLSHAGRNFQSIVLSATLSKEVAIIKTLLPHNLALVRLLNQELPEKKQLKQLCLRVQHKTAKFCVLLHLLKFEKIRGKCLVFCNNIKSSYKLKLFLDSFKFYSCVLNDQLPFNSRHSVVELFNSDQYDIIIATDLAAQSFRSEKKKHTDQEFSLSRGIDFQNVSLVLNFDFPTDSSVYIHRAGRTARGAKRGTVLSLIMPSDEAALTAVQERLKSDSDDATEESENAVEDYFVDMAEVDKLVYRVNDVLSSLSNKTIRSAQLQEIHTELLQSEKLKKHFKKHPSDLVAVQHGNNQAGSKLKRKFEDISEFPEYLAPTKLSTSDAGIEAVQSDTRGVLGESKDDGGAWDRKKAKKQLQKETLDYYKKLGLLKKGKKSRNKDPLKCL